jgi:hypothetical protein
VHGMILVGGTLSAGAVSAGTKWIACVGEARKGRRARKCWMRCVVWGGGKSILVVW